MVWESTNEMPSSMSELVTCCIRTYFCNYQYAEVEYLYPLGEVITKKYIIDILGKVSETTKKLTKPSFSAEVSIYETGNMDCYFAEITDTMGQKHWMLSRPGIDPKPSLMNPIISLVLNGG